MKQKEITKTFMMVILKKTFVIFVHINIFNALSVTNLRRVFPCKLTTKHIFDDRAALTL